MFLEKSRIKRYLQNNVEVTENSIKNLCQDIIHVTPQSYPTKGKRKKNPSGNQGNAEATFAYTLRLVWIWVQKSFIIAFLSMNCLGRRWLTILGRREGAHS